MRDLDRLFTHQDNICLKKISKIRNINNVDHDNDGNDDDDDDDGDIDKIMKWRHYFNSIQSERKQTTMT